jgi:hypothetical protein
MTNRLRAALAERGLGRQAVDPLPLAGADQLTQPA